MATIQRRARRSRRRSIIGVLVATLLVVAIPYAAAQTGSAPVTSGEFTGVVALEGGFRIDIPTGGAIAVRVDGSGPLKLTLADGTMDGTWSLDATQTTEGDMGGGLTITGGGPISASGAMSGPPGDYTMTGTYSQTNTATIQSVIGTQSSTVSDSGSVDVPLSDILILCDQIVGRWDFKVKQDLEAAGFDESIRGYFTASTGVDATEQAEEVEALIREINIWASSAPVVEAGGLGLYIGTAFSLLTRAQRLQAELAVPSPCPPDPTFMTDLSLAAQDALNTLLDRFPGITTPAIVSLALGTGAIGEGSPAADAAESLEARMESDVNAKFDSLFEGGTPNDGDVINTARAGQMLGMEAIGSAQAISPGDVLLVYGEAE